MIEQVLQERLRADAIRLGEVIVRLAEPLGYVIRHWQDDQPEQKLTVKTGSVAALEIVRYDAEGKYRPLKGAPSLRTGWELRVDSIAELRQTLDYFYPGAFAAWLAYNRGEITPVDLQQTLARQTGMYRVTQKLTDSQAEELAGRFCSSQLGCLRTILWSIGGKTPNRYLPSSKFDPQADQVAERHAANGWIPFLCAEACNLFVAEARKIVKVHST